MACENCAVLRERIADLERELGVRRRDGEIGALMGRFGITGTEARILQRLGSANGRVVGSKELMEETFSPSLVNLRTHISNLRQGVGADAIYNMQTHGYGLTPIGCSRVLAALSPPEMQRPIPLDEAPQ